MNNRVFYATHLCYIMYSAAKNQEDINIDDNVRVHQLIISCRNVDLHNVFVKQA